MKYIVRFFLVLIVIAVVSLFALVLKYKDELKFDTDKLVNYHVNLTTKIYDRNGKLISNIFEGEHREYVNFKDIPPRMVEAVVAIEDTAFFEHSGVNFEAILRAVLKAVKYGRLKEGASTITQQLVKNVLLTPKKTLKRKINEAVLAMKVERELTKEQIMERYLNEIYYGHRYYGVKTAAHGYFKKDLEDLNLKEIAILAGIPQRPNAYDPTKHYDLSLSRANTVLERMYNLGWISKEELEKYQKLRPKVYNQPLKRKRNLYIENMITKSLKGEFSDLKKGGYKVYTTLDLEIQELAQKALDHAYENILQRGDEAIKKGVEVDYSDLNGAMVVLDSHSGEVLAVIGSVSSKQSEFNRALQGKRQPGSSFKPFIYQVALNLGYSPSSKLADISRSFTFRDGDEDKEWKPKNYEKNFEGLITLRDALVHSRNLATINLVNEIGLSTVHSEVEKMGFEDIPMDLSISLGTFNISPLKFASMWTIFSNSGIRVEPKFVRSIVMSDGTKEVMKSIEHNVTTPAQTYLMTTILEDVIKRGTGRRIKVNGIELAGKTGTTNGYKDAWFCGYSPELTVIVWFGRDSNMAMYKETGGKAAAPAFAEFFSEYLKVHPETKREFDKPEGVREVTLPNGQKEYYTDISAPSDESRDSAEDLMDEELLF